MPVSVCNANHGAHIRFNGRQKSVDLLSEFTASKIYSSQRARRQHLASTMHVCMCMGNMHTARHIVIACPKFLHFERFLAPTFFIFSGKFSRLSFTTSTTLLSHRMMKIKSRTCRCIESDESTPNARFASRRVCNNSIEFS